MGSRKQLTQIVAVLAVVFLGCAYFLYTQMSRAGDSWPFFNEPGTLTNDINRINGEITRLQQEIAKIPAAEEALEKIRVDYELANRVLPRESSPDQLIAAIRLKAQQAGVIPDRLTPEVVGQGQSRGRGPATNFEEWSFSLDIRGSFDQIATFVNRMEEFESSDPTRTGSEKRFFKVTNIDITAEDSGMAFLIPPNAPEGQGRNGHRCSLVMSTFRYSGDN